MVALAGMVLAAGVGCSHEPRQAPAVKPTEAPAQTNAVDPATAGSIVGEVRFTGSTAALGAAGRAAEPSCDAPRRGGRQDGTMLTGPHGELGNVFVFIETGLEGRRFAAPTDPVVLEERGCSYAPRVVGVQVGQPVQVIDADRVPHHLHAVPAENAEWSQNQPPGGSATVHTFTRPEVMVPLRCSLHEGMRGYIGVLPHPYFVVTGTDGAFQLPNLPPGTYTVAAWHEGSELQRQTVTLTPRGAVKANFLIP